MWYYLFKDGIKIDTIHAPQDKFAFESYDADNIIEQWLTFDDESIVAFFMRVCKRTATQITATVDGHEYSMQWEKD